MTCYFNFSVGKQVLAGWDLVRLHMLSMTGVWQSSCPKANNRMCLAAAFTVTLFLNEVYLSVHVNNTVGGMLVWTWWFAVRWFP